MTQLQGQPMSPPRPDQADSTFDYCVTPDIAQSVAKLRL